jgi:cytochrome b subunit of formate dehydrogenase
LLCHEELEVELPSGTTETRIFNLDAFQASVHGQLEMSCVDCHTGIEDLPHDDIELPKVNCGECHEDQEEVYAQSLHGQSVANNDPLAPECWDCHGSHGIRAQTDPQARTNPIHVPQMCGACHAENAPVALARDVPQHDILENYTESIHGEGITQKGLTVTAVCTSCHTAHNVLPHTDPKSTIHRDNVVGVCTQCHAFIEEVHRKVIEGKLWEAEPEKVPICIDCHQPHRIRKVYYEEGVSDRDCMACHATAVQGATREFAAVDQALIASSAHGQTRCAQCHVGADPQLLRPCDTVPSKVDCSICHADQVEQHERSYHGQLLSKGDPEVPSCLDCHGDHGILPHSDPSSPTFPNNIPNLCADCHRKGEKAAIRGRSSQEDILEHYTLGIHGKGLIESGLLVTAVCTDCHTPHLILPHTDPESSIHRDNIPATCGSCHHGIEEKFSRSIHHTMVGKTDEKLPVCTDCHASHTTVREDEPSFKIEMMETCGHCHEDVAETYFDTYHGKVSRLGSAGAAKCHDCHGAHDILPPTDPHSTLSRENIVETCAQCHPGSHRQFAGYLTHATHHDPVKYPALFWAFWGMTGLLTVTFTVFGLHSLIWIPRAIVEKKRKPPHDESQPLIKRFDRISRQIHFVMILSFFGLALTGMALKFSYMPWAVWLSNAMGGFEAAGTIHRVCAIAMFVVFLVHLAHVYNRKRKKNLGWRQILGGSRTLVPNRRDLREFVQSMKWFLRMGPKPEYGKFTYWEKFDYFAVFWGVAIIGATGLILWFPELFTYVLPGWVINVATIVHSDEALLAVGFIFTIHFFNTHFRPDKFPMDMAMFTGGVPLDELKRERPGLYKELVESGEIEELKIEKPSPEFLFWSRLFGAIAILTGITLTGFILWSMIFGYR